MIALRQCWLGSEALEKGPKMADRSECIRDIETAHLLMFPRFSRRKRTISKEKFSDQLVPVIPPPPEIGGAAVPAAVACSISNTWRINTQIAFSESCQELWVVLNRQY